MNERLEIEGDMREDVRAELERIEGYEACPVPPVTDEDVDGHYADWCYRMTCYGCGIPLLEGEAYREEYCSFKCFCEVSCIDREDG